MPSHEAREGASEGMLYACIPAKSRILRRWSPNFYISPYKARIHRQCFISKVMAKLKKIQRSKSSPKLFAFHVYKFPKNADCNFRK